MRHHSAWVCLCWSTAGRAADEIRLQVEQLLRLVDTPKPNDGALAALPVLSAIRPEHLKERRCAARNLRSETSETETSETETSGPETSETKGGPTVAARVRALPGRSGKLTRADPTALVRASADPDINTQHTRGMHLPIDTACNVR